MSGGEFCFSWWDVCLGPSGGCGEPSPGMRGAGRGTAWRGAGVGLGSKQQPPQRSCAVPLAGAPLPRPAAPSPAAPSPQPRSSSSTGVGRAKRAGPASCVAARPHRARQRLGVGEGGSSVLPCSKQRVNAPHPFALSAQWVRVLMEKEKTGTSLSQAVPFLPSVCGLGIRAFGCPVGTTSSSCLPGL